MPKVTEMFAFVAADKDENDEGIIGIGLAPLLGADMARIASLMPIAKQVAMDLGKPVRLLKFKLVEDLGDINAVKH